MDPWGHLTPWQFKDVMEMENGEQQPDWHYGLFFNAEIFVVDLRPTIAITKAHMKASRSN